MGKVTTKRIHRKNAVAEARREVIARTHFSPELCTRAFDYALLGATLQEIANLLDVNDATVSDWIRDHEDFARAVKRGRQYADANVTAALYRRAIGFEYPVGVKKLEDGSEEIVMQYFPPDTTAMIFWLKNRQRDRWRDTQIGDGGVGIAIQINLDGTK